MTCLICLEDTKSYIKIDSCKCIQSLHPECYDKWIKSNNDIIKCIICKSYYKNSDEFLIMIMNNLLSIFDFLFYKIYLYTCFSPSSFFVMILYCFIVTIFIVFPYFLLYNSIKTIKYLVKYKKYNIIYKNL